MRIPPELVETLETVVDEGSFDAAALRLHVTPSAISQRIKALERQLGRVVVVRSRPVRATESGLVLLRLARQNAELERTALEELGVEHGDGPVTMPLAINADSLATWILPALARVTAAGTIALDIVRDDETRTASLLASGAVMAAVTSEARPVAGCTVTLLGEMTYRAAATRSFADRWFPHGVDADALAVAPVVDFDRTDQLQSNFARAVTKRRLDPPRHRIPGAADFAAAVRLGMGWAMLLDVQLQDPAEPRLIELAPDRPLRIPLYWQQWDIRSPALDRIAAEVRIEATRVLSGTAPAAAPRPR